MNPLQIAQDVSNRTWMEKAKALAKDRGEAFLVFLGGGASFLHSDAGAARDEARRAASYMGRGQVRIQRIKV
ncbi:MAG: hypothetical protein NTX56_19770 [Proteobacteria bacterium]|nr:hypothetical protein [Pseudomonadota bacterium]